MGRSRDASQDHGRQETCVLRQPGGPLVASDTNSFDTDIYMRSVGYQTPASASSLSVSLVPAFRQCGTGGNPANSAHAPPLATGSCNPPRPGSVLALFGPQAVGSAQLTAVPGDPTTAADEADVGVTASLTDIQAVGGGDYLPNPSGPRPAVGRSPANNRCRKLHPRPLQRSFH